MIAPVCQHSNRAKRGKDRKGNQRWLCRSCSASFISDEPRALGDMRIDMEQAVLVLRMLLEGMSIRACSRITGVKPDTICDLVVEVGEKCDKFLAKTVVGVVTKAAELDELWDFIGAKQKTADRNGLTGENFGDVWTWVAIDADSKLILSHATGDRGQATCGRFLRRLNNATTGRIQITSDGYACYTNAVPFEFGSRVDFAQLIKTYSSSQTETRYSPATITGIEINKRFGNPDDERISTSYAERFNLSVRMHVRRFTRLTNAFSKSFRHHSAMTALFVAFYNFCRKHETLEKKTPAMASGLTDRVWTIADLLNAAK